MGMLKLLFGRQPVEGQAGAHNALLVGQALPRFADLVRRGIVWGGGTAPGTGVAPGTALGATAAFALENPKQSQVGLVLIKLTVGYISGTLGAGAVYHVVDAGAAEATPIASSTALTAYNALLRSTRGTPTGRLHSAATLLNTPTVLRPAFNLDASLASSVVGREHLQDDIDGEFIVMPGSVWALEAVAAAGSSPLVAYGLTWAEVSLKELDLV